MCIDELTVLIPCKGTDCDSVIPPHNYKTLVIRNKLYGEAILEGLQQATTPYVGTMDADGQHQVRDLERLLRHLTLWDLDMAIGRRPHRGVGPRPAASLLLNLAASIVSGRHVPDLGCGARVFRRDMALELAPQLPEGFDFNAVLTTLALVRGYRVDWVRIPHRPRQQGQSHVRLRDGLKALSHLSQIATHE